MPAREQEPKFSGLTLEHVTNMAKETTLRHGQHQPTVIAEGSGRTMVVQVALPGTPEARIITLFAAGLALGQRKEISQLEQVFFICEGWMSRSVDGTMAVMPSQDPQRIEVLLISHLQVAEQLENLALFEMLREGEQLVDLRVLRSHIEENLSVHSPLLYAFATGFQLG